MGPKNDPQNNSCDTIGTYLEGANYTQLVAFSVSRTLFSLVDFRLPTSSIQLQSSDEDLAVGGSEDCLFEDTQTVHGDVFVAWVFSATLCQNVLNTLAKNSAHFSNQGLDPLIGKGQNFKHECIWIVYATHKLYIVRYTY